MEKVPSPKDLNGAAAVAQSLAYAAGLAGVVAGGLLYRDGEPALAVIAWILTFAVGAMLMIAAFLVRAIAGLLAHVARLESDVQVLVADRARNGDLDRGRDPWTRH
ncbi:MAG: hypothetical protein R3320_02890 [Nitriliruptorales bacterium]|nr:hypothetical protein [Nitriliruptorales bacterium]